MPFDSDLIKSQIAERKRGAQSSFLIEPTESEIRSSPVDVEKDWTSVSLR